MKRPALIVVHDAWRPDLLALIHRAEARTIANELRRAGHAVTSVSFDADRIGELRESRPILRLSDPLMVAATHALARSRTPYIGPAARVLAQWYDKFEASRIAARHGSTCPETVLGNEAARLAFPAVLKPRRGSDSIGLRLFPRGPIR